MGRDTQGGIVPLAQDANLIFRAGLDAVLPSKILPKVITFKDNSLHVKNDTYHLKPNQRIFCFGSGKAAHTMAQALYEILENRLAGGVIVSPNENRQIGPIKHIKSSHPIPDTKSLQAGHELIEAMKKLNEDDFYIYLLSGGSSALIEELEDAISLEDLQNTTQILLANNLPITTINWVRKRISKIKGGGLAKVARAKGVVLVISDVIGDDLKTIGSAPLMSLPSDAPFISDAILKTLPKSILPHLKNSQPPKKANNPPHYLIASNKIALKAAAKKAMDLGYSTTIVSSSQEGLTKNVASKIYFEILKSKPKTCLLYGGEPTVKITGNGKGGRNQQVVLHFLKHLNPNSDIGLLSAGTDGIDGNSPAAGAYGDKNILLKAKDLQLDIDEYLFTCNAYEFFSKTKSAIITGPTGTNVMDILIALKE